MSQGQENGAETVQPLMAFVTFYRGQAKVFETSPLVAREATAARLKTVPLKFSFPLDTFPPGEYVCQVTVIDPQNRKAAFWQAPVMLAP